MTTQDVIKDVAGRIRDLRQHADSAAAHAKELREAGDKATNEVTKAAFYADSNFQSGRQAAFITAKAHLVRIEAALYELQREEVVNHAAQVS